MRNTERGSALVESIPVIAVIAALVGGALIVFYVMFARAWIDFQSEQAIYCAAVDEFDCRGKLVRQLERFLPWGHVHAQVWRGETEWSAEVIWKWNEDYRIAIYKRLTPKLMTGKTDLHW